MHALVAQRPGNEGRKVALENKIQDLIDSYRSRKYLEVNSRDEKGFSPLHLAVHNPKAVEILLKNTAAVSVRGGPLLQTPLHLAAQNGYEETCKRLIASSIKKEEDLNVEDAENKTALDRLIEKGHFKLIPLFC